jgi:hypothetical protein
MSLFSSQGWAFTKSTMATGISAAPVEEPRLHLRAIGIKCFSDWDITLPEVRTAWNEGRKDLFYPYGKSFTQSLAGDS